MAHDLDNFDMTPTVLEREWVLTIDTPAGGVDQVVTALGAHLPLVKGLYDTCMYIREGGYQRFRALPGSHAGDEGTIQQVSACQIVITLPPDEELLSKAFDVILAVHVNEEPTIRVTEEWGSHSKRLNDKDNPNRYWNRPDAQDLHGKVVG